MAECSVLLHGTVRRHGSFVNPSDVICTILLMEDSCRVLLQCFWFTIAQNRCAYCFGINPFLGVMFQNGGMTGFELPIWKLYALPGNEGNDDLSE